MSVSLPSLAIFPGAPAGTPLAAGAEGLAAFGNLAGNSDVAPAFGPMLAAATADPSDPLVAAVTIQDGAGDSTPLATPGAGPADNCATAQAAMLVPFRWSHGEETKAPTDADFATNEGLSVELGMNASADRSGMAATTPESATTDSSAETAPDETPATVGTDAPPTVSGRSPEAPAPCLPTTAERPDATGQKVPVAPARTQSHRRNPTMPNATRSAAGAAPAVAISTPAPAMTSAGRLAIPATNAGAGATPAPVTGGRRNIAGPVALSAPVSASTAMDNVATPVVAGPASPVTLATEPSVSMAGIFTPPRPATPVSKAGLGDPASAADNAPSTGSATPVLPGIEVPAPLAEKPAVGPGPTGPVGVQPQPSAPPAMVAAVVPDAAIVAPSPLAMPVAKPVALVAAADSSSVQATAQFVASPAAPPEFPVGLPSAEPTANLAAGPTAPVLVTPAAAPAGPIAPIVVATPPDPAAESVVVPVLSAVVLPDAAELPISSGQGSAPTPVASPVAPAVGPAAPETKPGASANAQPRIYEQQILAGPKGPAASAMPSASVSSGVAVPASFALPIATAPAKTENLDSKAPDIPPSAAVAFTISTLLPLPVDGSAAVAPAETKPSDVAADARNLERGAGFPSGLATPVAAFSVEFPLLDSATGDVQPAPLPNVATSGPVPALPVPATPMMPAVDLGALADVADPAVFALPTGAWPAKIEHPKPPALDLPPSAPRAFTTPAPLPPALVVVNPGTHATALDPTALPSTSGDPQALADLSPVQMPAVEVPAVASGDVQPAPLANLATPAPVPVPVLSEPVAAASVPVPPALPVVANPVWTTAPTVTLEPTVDTLPDSPGQEMPVLAAEPTEAEGRLFTPVTTPPVPVTEPNSALVPTTVVATEPSPAKANEAKPVLAQHSRPLRKAHRQPTEEVPAVALTVPAPASNLPIPVVVEPTAVAESGLPTNAPLFAPVVSVPTVLPDSNAVVSAVVPPAVLPAGENAGPTGNDADATPRRLRPETPPAGTDLASALAASLTAISTPVGPEQGSDPTEKSGAREDLGNARVPTSAPRQAPAMGRSSGTPMDPIARPAYSAPATVTGPAGLPADSSPADAPALSLGTELPDAASVGAFPSQVPVASRPPVSALPDDSPDAFPSAEDAVPVAMGVGFVAPAAVRIRRADDAVVPPSASTVAAILAETTQPDPTAEGRKLQRRPAAPNSPVTSTAMNVDDLAVPVASAATVAVGPVTDAKPESAPAFSLAAPTGETAAPSLPEASLGEKRSLPAASVAADPDISSTAEIPLVGAVPEKFAERFAAERAEPRGLGERAAVKNTIDVVGQQEKAPTTRAGINAAKKSDTMLSDQPQTSSAAPTSKSSAPAADAAARFDVSTIAASKPEQNHTEWVQPAGRTLAIVRDVAEHLQTSANRVVEFDVNSQPGMQLSVRLEYRGGVVHTTFRTDSTELRATLTREWQSGMPTMVAGERSVRLAEPTFTAALAPRGENQSLDLGGQTTRQQQQDTPQPQEKAAFSSDFAFARGASARRPAASVPAPDTLATPTLAPDTAPHLHAFA